MKVNQKPSSFMVVCLKFAFFGFRHTLFASLSLHFAVESRILSFIWAPADRWSPSTHKTKAICLILTVIISEAAEEPFHLGEY